MLTQAQRDQFDRDGYIVVEDVIDMATQTEVDAEYAKLMAILYDAWHAQGLVRAATTDMGSWEMLDVAYRCGFDWYQLLDIVESLIGPELTSNPFQHVRIKPPEDLVESGEIRAHIVTKDWHQDKGVTLESADGNEMVTVWLALKNATIENGCLKVKPGIRDEMLPHCTLKQTGITGTNMQMDAKVQLSQRDHIPKHRWSSDGPSCA
ncbi:phytanoyl-CoA dioxygenase family protein [Octadecabacter sp. CECT 8868]|uniref:phytanoyl-CoA dioxygenase family protein n=1 Tax=Octadecabacter algicola TaxID=2909342 RepID=UPI001F26C02A|nr:phytanoyl-CoA dioxygenase family protein [Octadecabacter algicola]MCF2903819.1 phytanoyl-CoA dioxygenase family protein [Octadecabacter algicola]